MKAPKTRTEFQYFINHASGVSRCAGVGPTWKEALYDAGNAFENPMGAPGEAELLQAGYVVKVQQVYAGKDRWIDDGTPPVRVTGPD